MRAPEHLLSPYHVGVANTGVSHPQESRNSLFRERHSTETLSRPGPLGMSPAELATISPGRVSHFGSLPGSTWFSLVFFIFLYLSLCFLHCLCARSSFFLLFSLCFSIVLYVFRFSVFCIILYVSLFCFVSLFYMFFICLYLL